MDWLERWQAVLVHFAQIDPSQPEQLSRQAHNLFEAQAFCHSHRFPAGLMKALSLGPKTSCNSRARTSGNLYVTE